MLRSGKEVLCKYIHLGTETHGAGYLVVVLGSAR